MRIALHSALANVGSLHAVLAEVRRSAEHGLAGYWSAMLDGQDTLTALAVAGREVGGIELGTAVVPIPLRSPYALAQQVATVEEAAGGGRLALGLGTSHEAYVRAKLGGEWSAPLAAMRAYLDELARVMADAGRPTTPVLVGAVNPAMAALAAERAAGVITWAAGVRTLREVVLPARDRAQRKDFRIVVSLPVCVTDDEDAARHHIAVRMGAYDALPSYQRVLRREGANGVAELSVVGSPESVRRQLDAFAECGATDFAAHPVPANRADAERTWELLADHAR